ncbi:uncharacterized protein G2W53_000736 [Senna tora]|uniref:Uncharacterized protein n=1 Tax=Senna tora TaxID=362788 RepID=A0A834XH47_9FABA|nr:uncharacterized protein G2W53_000736 [Senna tora]
MEKYLALPHPLWLSSESTARRGGRQTWRCRLVVEVRIGSE